MARKAREREITVSRTVKQVEKACPVCRRLFWGAKISRYCSRACKNRADYERHIEQRRQHRVEKYQTQKGQSGQA